MTLNKFFLAGGFLLASMNAALAAPANGAAIAAAISGNTVAGNMDASGPYAEFYEAGGTIKGDGYTGKWSIEGDTMCFEYEGTAKDCWAVEISGDQVRWLKDGAGGGTGTILPGNANNF
jgi:hypothetical protein